MDSKRIGTFKQFLKEQGKQKIDETKLNVEVEWWDECILEVMQELEEECQGFLVWETIIKYCKDKWTILGRALPLPVYEDSLLTQHIKDLIFQFHGKSFYTDCKCDFGWDNAQIHSKGLVIEELAAVILDKVKERAKPEDETPSKNPTGTLSDKEDITLVPMKPAAVYDNCEDEYCEDLPFEYERKEVYGFEKYSKMIEDAKSKFKLANRQKLSETYIKEEPTREEPPKSEIEQQLEEFAHNKEKRSELIKAWTEISDHPAAEDLNSPVGSSFSKEDLDEELRAAYNVLDDGGFIYASFEHSLWIKKGQLIRVM